MYFVLVNDALSDFDFYIKSPSDLPRDVDFISGTTIKADALRIPLKFTTDAFQGEKLLDFKDGTILLMSKKCVEFFKSAGVGNLQCFPAIIKSDVDGTIWENYFAVNILGLVQCADLEKSEFSEIMPGSYRFRELAIHTEKANEQLLFRLKEEPGTILMHKNVGSYIVQNDPDEELLGWEADDIMQ